MEDSPLTLAHQHASTASNILRSSAPPHSPSTLLAAASSHALASTSFAAAVKLTKDPEALRTLELLSTEHERWGARLRLEAERPIERFGSGGAALETVVEGSASTENVGEEPTSATPVSKLRAKEALPPPPPPSSLPFANTGTAPIPPRLQKSTSSLATNLASARGIPQQSRLGSGGGGTTSPTRRRSLLPERSQTLPTPHDYHPSSSKPTTNPLNLLPPDDPTPPPPKRASTTPRLSTRVSAPDLHTTTTTSSSDEPFSKFYTSLNTLVSRIGSPFAASLAFAGLPLTDDPSSPVDPDPPASTLLPRAWTAGRTGPGGGGGGALGGAESFYVVPVTGGTLSYAGVVRRGGGGGDTGKKTKEELQLENTGLRQTIDHMSRTMQSWQRKTRESEHALKNSILAMGGAERELLSQVQRRSWMHVPYDEGEDDDVGRREVEERVGVLEEELEGAKRELEAARRAAEKAGREAEGARREAEKARRETDEWRGEAESARRENEKLKAMLEKLKAKWERLKEGARSRKAAGASGTGSGSGSAALGRVEEGE